MGLVKEYGLLYQINYGPYHKNAQHLKFPWYHFHGAIPRVHHRDLVDMIDEYRIPTYYGANGY